MAPRRAPSYGFSRHTLDLLLDAGFSYDASLLGGDIPYVIASDRGRLVVRRWDRRPGQSQNHYPSD